MITLLPVLRDFLNLRIEERPELWGVMKNFSNTLIEVRFVDKPLKDFYLNFHIDNDGLLNSSTVKNNKKPNSSESKSFIKHPDIIISIDNTYLTQIGEEFMGWGLDFSRQDLPDSNVFTSGLRIEGNASSIQELAPLLKLILNDLSPLATFIKKSPVNFAIKNIIEYLLHKEKLLVLQEEFEGFIKDLRGLRNDIERTEKKIEILGQRIAS